MKNRLDDESIGNALRSALSQDLIRNDDSLLMFHALYFLENRYRSLKNAFPDSALHGIAMKANPLRKILEFLLPLGAGTEVASPGELYLAMKAGYPPSRIVFDSPAKTISELEFALKSGVHINADSLAELERIFILKKNITKTGTIGIRINPQIGTGTIEESSVAGFYSKFGVPIGSGRDALTEAFLKYDWLTGVHLHVGSQGCSQDLLLGGIGIVYDFVLDINEKRQAKGMPPVDIFDIGGGLPIAYLESQHPVTMEEYAAKIRERFPMLFTKEFRIFTEFGRWSHANAGWTVSRVEYVKREPGVNTLMIHAGADLFLRECLNPSSWPHEYSVYTKTGKLKTGRDETLHTLAGPLCFSGDILAKNVSLPFTEEGDYLVIHDTGGYTFSMWSRYNSRQTPRILGYRGSAFEILHERETMEQLERFWE